MADASAEARAFVREHPCFKYRAEQTDIALALDAFRTAGAPKLDDPEADATDAAHPAWWRGNNAGVAVTVARLADILDGKDDGEGVIGYAPLEALRRRLLVLVAKPDTDNVQPL